MRRAFAAVVTALLTAGLLVVAGYGTSAGAQEASLAGPDTAAACCSNFALNGNTFPVAVCTGSCATTRNLPGGANTKTAFGWLTVAAMAWAARACILLYRTLADGSQLGYTFWHQFNGPLGISFDDLYSWKIIIHRDVVCT